MLAAEWQTLRSLRHFLYRRIDADAVGTKIVNGIGDTAVDILASPALQTLLSKYQVSSHAAAQTTLLQDILMTSSISVSPLGSSPSSPLDMRKADVEV